MGSNDYNEANMSTVEDAESSDTTVEIKLKTLDSQTYTLRVNKHVPVLALKEQIATVTGVFSEQQRLICRGTVLKDDQLLSAYHVEDGHTLHLVFRQPAGSYAASDNPAHNSPSSSNLNQGHPADPSVLYEELNNFESIIPRLLSIMRSVAIGMAVGDLRDTMSERIARPTANAVPANSANNAEPSPAPPMSEEIPDSLTTINQYIGSLRDQFRREALGVNGMQEEDRSVSGGVNGPDPADGGLPNVAHLANIVRSTRELLTEQATGCLSQLARQLDGQANVADPLLRRNIQTSALRSGVCIQNLGALLLELGRTTMALHMGESPSEASVNSGPSVFISASGPNPLMVQPRSFHPRPTLSGVRITRLNFSHGLQGHAVPAGNASLGEQAGGLQAQVQTDQARNVSGSNFFDQILSGPTDSAPITGLSGARVVPVRQVVAVPAGVNRLPSDPSGNSVGLTFPVLHLNPGLVTGGRSTQASTEPHPGSYNLGQLPLPDENQLPANTLPTASGLDQSAHGTFEYQGSERIFIPRRRPTASNNDDSAQADNRQQSREHATPRSTFEQWIGGLTRGREANVSAIDQQEPLISARGQTNTTVNGVSRENPSSSTAQAETDNSAGSNSSQERRDHSDAPCAKRLKND